MRMGKGINRVEYNYHIYGNKLKESYNERDLRVDITLILSPEYRMRTTRESNYILVCVKTAFKYMDNGMLRTYIRCTSDPSQNMLQQFVLSWEITENFLEKVRRNAVRLAPKFTGMSYEEMREFFSLLSLEERRVSGDKIQKYTHTKGLSEPCEQVRHTKY